MRALQLTRVAFVALVMATTFGCQSMMIFVAGRMSEPDFEAPPADIAVQRDIVFAQTEHGPLDLNLYLPKVRPNAKLPLIVWVHGGGWFVGNKHQVQIARAYNLTRRGYAVASVSYRLSVVTPYPAQIHDVKASVRYLRAHADELGLDTERIGIWGASAGGHLVALMGTTNSDPKFEGDVGGAELAGYSSDVAAVVNYFGPVDLQTMHVDLGNDEPSFMLTSFIDGSLDDRRDVAIEASPTTWAAASSAPMLQVHGIEDPIVAFKQSERLHEALTRAGADSTLRPVVGGGHGGGGDFDGDVLIEEAGDFFDQHLKR